MDYPVCSYYQRWIKGDRNPYIHVERSFIIFGVLFMMVGSLVLLDFGSAIMQTLGNTIITLGLILIYSEFIKNLYVQTRKTTGVEKCRG